LTFQAAYSQLVFAGKRDHDPVSAITNDPRVYLAQSLHKMSASNPGMVSPLISQLQPVVQGHVQKYLQQTNLTI
jgi:exportin-2 (importin alpha re-exporter)